MKKYEVSTHANGARYFHACGVHPSPNRQEYKSSSLLSVMLQCKRVELKNGISSPSGFQEITVKKNHLCPCNSYHKYKLQTLLVKMSQLTVSFQLLVELWDY